MTTGYTQADLDQLHRLMMDRAPPLPTLDDLKTTPTTTAAAFNGSHTGLLLQLQFPADQCMVLNINCVVATELMLGINEAAFKYKWWDKMPAGGAEEDSLPIYSTDHDDSALAVFTLTTGASNEGMLITFGDGNEAYVQAFLPRSVARGVVVAIISVAERGGWWDEEFGLLPVRVPEEIEIQRAANKLIKRYGERAAWEATFRSNAAIEAGDTFNHQLWQRVSLVVSAMEETSNKASKSIN
jgi:hypothetical protein